MCVNVHMPRVKLQLRAAHGWLRGVSTPYMAHPAGVASEQVGAGLLGRALDGRLAAHGHMGEAGEGWRRRGAAEHNAELRLRRGGEAGR